MCLQYKSFEDPVGKGEIARNEQSPIPSVFSTCLENFMPFSSNLELSSANSFSLKFVVWASDKLLPMVQLK